MDEFLKIKWPPKEAPQPDDVFVSEECMRESYVFKDLPLHSSDSEHEKSVNESNYIPGKVYFVKGKCPSKLSKLEHFECLHALKILQGKSEKKALSFFDKKCLTMYNDLRSTIMEENGLFQKHAQKQWKYTNLIPFEKYMFIVNLWKQQLRRSLAYERYYKECNKLSLSCFEDEDYIEVLHLKNILEMGHLAKFSHPTVKTKCFLNIDFSDEDTMFTLNSKLPVSQDKNISKLIEQEAFQLVISSSAVKKLMDCDNWNHNWDIPVIIKTEKGKKIVFVDKTLPQKAPTVRQLNEKLYKNGLKANLCYLKALSFEHTEDLIPDPTSQDTIDLKNVNIFDEKNDKEEFSNIKRNLSAHNVSYRIWSFKPKSKDNLPKTDQLELRILIRCKLDACEKLENNTLQPVVVAPKLEYQLGYGAEEPTKSELSNLWTSLFFRPYSTLHRVRLNPVNGEVVTTETCSLQTLNSEAMHFHKSKPFLGLHVVYRICKELVQQEIGDYVLHHTPEQGAFVSLGKAVEIKRGGPRIGVYDLHTEYKVINCEPIQKHPWRPIDPNFILPVHTAFKRMPGMFIPRDKKLVPVKRKKKSKKANKKRKITKQLGM